MEEKDNSDKGEYLLLGHKAVQMAERHFRPGTAEYVLLHDISRAFHFIWTLDWEMARIQDGVAEINRIGIPQGFPLLRTIMWLENVDKWIEEAVLPHVPEGELGASECIQEVLATLEQVQKVTRSMERLADSGGNIRLALQETEGSV